MKNFKAEANRLGFSLIGTSAALPPHSYPVYLDWIRAGRNAGMKYLAEDRHLNGRTDPRSLLPSAKTILSFAYPYPNPLSYPISSPIGLSGRIAAYAWLPDYHVVIEQKLTLLMQGLSADCPSAFEYSIAVDAKPILERDYGQRAGLGWIGRNSCLIRPDSGSYFLLAEVIIDLPPEEMDSILGERQQPISDHCGTCRRCVDACPTGCIRADRILDAGKCISFLTIENKHKIPYELRSQVGEWVFGCDICQIVCPWNERFADRAWSGEVPTLTSVDLFDELSLTEAGFREKYKNSPILRAKYKGWMRNVCVAIGNQKDARCVHLLEQIISGQSDPLIKSHAIWAYHQISGDAGKGILQKVRLSEVDPQVLEEFDRLPL